MQQPNDSYRLVVRRGPQPNQTYELTKNEISLGRDITNDIVINDPEVSRHHLRLTRGADGAYYVEDLGSTNGTFVNGQRVTGSRALNNGDMMGLGETVTLGYERARPAGAPDVGVGAPGYGQQPAPSPYAQPAQPAYNQPAAPSPYESQQPAPAYEPQQEQGYGYYQQGSTQQDYGNYAAPAYGQPAAPYGQDYDPYAVREEEPRSTMRWIGIGCLVLGIFCCCSTGVGLVLVDSLNLWDRLPVVKQIGDLLRPIADIFF